VSRPPDKSIKLVAKNKKAYFNYEVLDKVEAGLVLVGSEVKSLRTGKLQLVDAYAKIESGEAWLIHAHIGDYDHAGAWAHDPTRKRKLLLHREEIEKLESKVREKGFTLVPLEVYFKEGRAKVLLGVCKGKAVHDKRKTIRERDEQRAIERDLSES
jgi:SsrA-binding protein